MFDLNGQRVLITQAHVQSYGGSEIVTHEVAEYFSRQGADVIVATAFSAEPMSTELSSIPRVRIADLDDPALAADLVSSPPRLAWIHHQLIPTPLLEDPSRTTFVFNHMSSIHPIEFPYSAAIESSLADLSLFVSEEIRERQSVSGLLAALDPRRTAVFNNPAPSDFARDHGIQPLRQLPTLLVVTNHIVDEVRDALALLDSDFEVRVVGAQSSKGATPIRVTPELIHSSDAVLTIGKTVQYALIAGVPVYCYDLFGGPGWLSPANFERAAHGHFCGRGFRQTDAETIAAEIRGGFAQARQDAAILRTAHSAEFTLEVRLESLLSQIEPRAEAPSVDWLVRAQHVKTQEVIVHYLRSNRRLETTVTKVRRDSDERSAGLRLAVEDMREAREHERARARKAEGAAEDLRVAREAERSRARFAEEAARRLREEIAALRRAARGPGVDR